MLFVVPSFSEKAVNGVAEVPVVTGPGAAVLAVLPNPVVVFATKQ